jgi:hypothetical protein
MGGEVESGSFEGGKYSKAGRAEIVVLLRKATA